jgi:hypothetical protein
MFPQDLGSLVGLTLTLAVLFLALLGVAAVVVARVALHRFLATRVRFMELAGPLVIYLAVTVAVSLRCGFYSQNFRNLWGELRSLYSRDPPILHVCPFHRLDPTVMAVAAPHDARLRPMTAQALAHMPDDGAHLAALGVRAGRRIAATGVPLAT